LIPFCSMNSVHRLSMNGKGKLQEEDLIVLAKSEEQVT